MSSKDDSKPKEFGNSDGPATSWVRMPSRDPRAAPAPRTPEPPPAWSPPAARGPSEAPRASDAANPFGGFQAGQTTGVIRRSAQSGRFWAVFGVVIAVLGLSAAAIFLALRPDPKPPETPPKESAEVKPPEPKPEPVDEGDAEAEALGYTKAGEKTTSSGAKSTGSKNTGAKGTKTTKSATSTPREGNPGKTRPQGH